MKAKIVLLIIATVLLLVTSAFAQQAGQNPQSLNRFTDALTRDGLDWSVGGVTTANWAADYCSGKIENASYYNVPSVMPAVPQNGVNVVDFKLRPDEAIVLIGLTPPPVKYYGYYLMLSSKVYPKGMFGCTDPQGCRLRQIATLGDAVNNGTIHTIGPTRFNTPVVLIYTPDQGTDDRVRAALRRAGYPAEIINTVIVPSSMLNLGLGEDADTIRLPTRNGMWDVQADGDAYVATPPLTVFRVTPHVPTDPADPADLHPFPAPPLRVRGTGQTEMGLMNKLGQLRQSILSAHSGLYATEYVASPNWYEGFDYLQQGRDPWSDTRDGLLLTAGYLPEFGSNDQITLDDDEFLMVYGANHVATGKATYSSISAYSGLKGKLSIGSVYHDSFANTATLYLPGDLDANKMYAYKVSRNCGNDDNADCMQLSLDNCPKLTIGPDTVIGFIFRNYLEPSTNVGPVMPEILYDRVIKFSPRP